MDSLHNSGSRIRKLNSLNEGVSQLNAESPLTKHLLTGSSIASPYGGGLSSPTIRTALKGGNSSSGGSGSRGSSSVSIGGGLRRRALLPLSAVEKVKSSPIVVEDEVLVMDEIQVASRPSGARVLRSPSSVGSSSASSSSASGNGLYRTELCFAWENGRCRFGSTCQFAHGKEELIPSSNYSSLNNNNNNNNATATANNNKSEPGQSSKSYGAVARKSEALHGGNCQFLPPVVKEAAASQTVSSPATRYECWSPMDDGIQVDLPSQSEKYFSREEVDAHIHSLLYGPCRRRRLPVFTEFCP